jgi:hypothetical protein
LSIWLLLVVVVVEATLEVEAAQEAIVLLFLEKILVEALLRNPF